jgi:hypothetical protein
LAAALRLEHCSSAARRTPRSNSGTADGRQWEAVSPITGDERDMATRIRNCSASRWSATRTPPVHHTLRGPFDDSGRSFHFYDDGKVTFLTPMALVAKLASLFTRPTVETLKQANPLEL